MTDLVRRAEEGDDVVLTRHGRPAVRLVPIRAKPDPAARRAILDDIHASAAREAAERGRTGPTAASSQDFLYGEDGLPE